MTPRVRRAHLRGDYDGRVTTATTPTHPLVDDARRPSSSEAAAALARAVVLLALPRVPVPAGLRRGRRRGRPGGIRGPPRRRPSTPWPTSPPTAPPSATRSRRTVPRLGVRLPAPRRRRGRRGRPVPRCPPGATPARGRVRRSASRSSTPSTGAPSRWPTRSCTPRGQPFVMAFQAGGPARAGPGPRGDRRRPGRAGARAGVAWCGRSPGATGTATPRPSACRRTTASCRAASPWSSGATPSRPGTATRACSPRWSPATRSSSSPTRGRSLPLAISVAAARSVLREAGFDPALVQLAAEADGEGLAKTLAERDEVADHRLHRRPRLRRRGWRRTARPRGQLVYTEKAGVNTIVVDSTDNLRGTLGNLAFSLALYSGQMCTTPQNIYVPRGRHRHRRGPPVLRGVRPAARRGGGQAHRRRRPRGRAARRHGQRRGARQRPRPRAPSPRRPAARSCSTPGSVSHPAYPDAVVRAPGLGRARRQPRGRLHAGVLRAGHLPHRARRRPRSRWRSSATPSASTAR